MQRNSKVILGVTLAAFLFVGAALTLVFDIFTSIPNFEGLKTSIDVPILLANGDKAVKKMGPRTSDWAPLGQISKYLPRAVVASEDTSFYSHDGIDVHEIREAIKKDFKEGKMARGASTLTQQVLKNVYLGNQKTLLRKIKEIFWAGKLEKALTKSEILAFYLNMAEWGPGLYGIKGASNHYFGCPPSELSAKQSAFLAMLLPSPRRYHSYFNRRQLTAWAEHRVERILGIMTSMGFLDDSEFEVASAENLWGNPSLPDDAPGAPKDPGNVTESPEELFESSSQLSRRTPKPGAPAELEAIGETELPPSEPDRSTESVSEPQSGQPQSKSSPETVPDKN